MEKQLQKAVNTLRSLNILYADMHASGTSRQARKNLKQRWNATPEEIKAKAREKVGLDVMTDISKDQNEIRFQVMLKKSIAQAEAGQVYTRDLETGVSSLVPNETTIAAMEEARAGNLETFNPETDFND